MRYCSQCGLQSLPFQFILSLIWICGLLGLSAILWKGPPLLLLFVIKFLFSIHQHTFHWLILLKQDRGKGKGRKNHNLPFKALSLCVDGGAVTFEYQEFTNTSSTINTEDFFVVAVTILVLIYVFLPRVKYTV